MRKLFLIALLLSCLSGKSAITMTNGTVAVFLGDSITDAHLFSAYMESFYWMRNPSLTNLNFGEESAGGSQIGPGNDSTFLARFDAYVVPWVATHVFTMATPNGSTSSNDFLNSFILLTDKVRLTNSALNILLGVHPTDTATGSTTIGMPRSFIHQVVGTWSNYPYVNLWTNLNVSFSNNYNYKTSANPAWVDLGWADSTHPGPAGHLVIANALLKGLGEDGFISGAAIDASGNAVRWSSNCTIGSLSATATSANFTRLDTKLAMCWDASASNGIAFSPDVLTNLNRMPLIVSNLNAGTYSIEIDGQIVTNASHTDLAAGINLAALTTNVCSYWTQRVEVLGRIRDKLGVDRTTRADKSPNAGVVKFRSNAFAYKNQGLTGPDLITAMATVRNEMFALNQLISAAAQPVTRSFEIYLEGQGGGGGGGDVQLTTTNRMSGNVRISGNARF